MATTTNGATIFYTQSNTSPAPAPTHNGATATGATQTYNGQSIDIGNCGHTYFKAIAYESGYGDSVVNSQDYNHGSCGGFGPSMMMSSQSSTVTVFSVWDGDWGILEEYDANGNRVEGYVQGYHGLVKTLVTNVYYYQDELGSTSHIASGTGSLIESYQYDVYGKPRVYNSAGVYQAGATPVAKDLFTGHRWRSELGLYDDRNRFMSPDLGRFLQPDPIGFKGDASNLYRYCGNDWANRSDPMGLESVAAGGARAGEVQNRQLTERDKDWAAQADNLKFSQAGNNFIQSARPDAKGVEAKEVGQKGYADAKKDAENTQKDIKRDAAGQLGREYITAEFAKNGKLTTDGPKKGEDPTRGERYTKAEYKSFGEHPLVITHSHGPQSNPYHEGNDKPNAEGRNGNTPYISFLAHSSQPGRVQAYIPSPNRDQRAHGSGGSFFHSTDGINWTSGQ